MSKPNINTVLRLKYLKEAAQKIHDEIDDKPFLKFVITDNVAALLNGEKVWKSTQIKPLSYEIKGLKNKPKGM